MRNWASHRTIFNYPTTQDLVKAEADLTSVFNNDTEFQKLEKQKQADKADPITFGDLSRFLSIRRNALGRAFAAWAVAGRRVASF